MTETYEIGSVLLAQLRERHPDLEGRLADEGVRRAVVAIAQASRFLRRLLVASDEALDVLTDLGERRPCDADSPESLRRWKQLELLRIAALDVTGTEALPEVAARLSQLATDVVESALRLVGVEDELVVIGMGKLGGRELNYASDIDLMFVGEVPDGAVREVMDVIRRCFRVDINLRPEGRDGAIVRTVDSFVNYWERWAEPWEFQALLKARPIAGPSSTADRWQSEARAALWSRGFGPDALRSLRAMKARSEDLIVRSGLAEREVKRGPGGIRDIEFAVQLLQLVHGGRDESIRSANTLTALGQLGDGGYIASDDVTTLSECYVFLRTVEHRLQLVEEEQTHTVPKDKESRSNLAGSLGYRGTQAVQQFENDLRERQTIVRHAHERLYFRPLLEAFAADVAMTTTDSAVEAQLTAFGFSDVDRTRAAVRELTRGLARSSRLMQQLMPLLLDWLSTAPDPDAGLLGLRTLIAGFRTPQQVVGVFRDSPEVARRICMLLGTGRLFAHGFARFPEVIAELGRDDDLTPASPVRDRLETALEWRESGEARRDALLRLARAEQLRIGAADVLEVIDAREAARRRTSLASAVLEIALEHIQPEVPTAVIGVGRFGGSELAYVSDLDLIVVHDGTSPEGQAAAERVATELIQRIGSSNPLLQLYSIDYDLRPEGKKGVLARSLTGCADYYARWASHWERQALLRARVVAGDQATGRRFMDLVDEFVWGSPLGTEAIREMRHLKARMERERIPRGGDPEFHLKLGRGSLSDVEWTTQFLQMQHGVRETNTLGAIDTLQRGGHLDADDAEVLRAAWQFCDSARNRLFLITQEHGDALPANLHTLALLARSLQIPELRERYRSVTRRARRVTERLFYGTSE